MHERTIRDELRNVVLNYPVWPGNTISHATARICEERGWVTRDESGDWIPTCMGIWAYSGSDTRWLTEDEFEEKADD